VKRLESWSDVIVITNSSEKRSVPVAEGLFIVDLGSPASRALQ